MITMTKSIRVMQGKVGEDLEVVQMEHTLDSMQKMVGGYIELVKLPYDIDLWINEEGLLMDLELNFRTYIKSENNRTARSVHSIHGDVYFASHDGEGNTTSLSDLQILVIKHMFRIDRKMMMVIE